MENFANALSSTIKPQIIAESTSSIINYGPFGHQGYGGWQWLPVGRGQFTCEADKAHLGPVIANLIEKRKAHALQEGDMLWLDNRLVMHARRPYEGPRRILASIAIG